MVPQNHVRLASYCTPRHPCREKKRILSSIDLPRYHLITNNLPCSEIPPVRLETASIESQSEWQSPSLAIFCLTEYQKSSAWISGFYKSVGRKALLNPCVSARAYRNLMAPIVFCNDQIGELIYGCFPETGRCCLWCTPSA